MSQKHEDAHEQVVMFIEALAEEANVPAVDVRAARNARQYSYALKRIATHLMEGNRRHLALLKHVKARIDERNTSD